MALFGGKKKDLIQRLACADWSGPGERAALIQRLNQRSMLRLGPITELLWARDPAVRAAAVDIFVDKLDTRALGALFERLQAEPAQHRGRALAMLKRVDPATLAAAID